MATRGRISDAWNKGWDPNPVPPGFKPKINVKFVRSKRKLKPDGMADYIEDADWWLARSERNATQLIRMFDRGDVAICLYEKTGAIIQIGHVGRLSRIAIQIVRTGYDWDVDLCLTEAGVYLDEIVENESELLKRKMRK